MKSKKMLVLMTIVSIIISITMAGYVVADENQISIKGKVKNISMSNYTVTITTKDGDVKVLVEDEETLNKFRTGKIVEGDDVKVKYIIRDGVNVSTFFRKAGGC